MNFSHKAKRISTRADSESHRWWYRFVIPPLEGPCQHPRPQPPRPRYKRGSCPVWRHKVLLAFGQNVRKYLLGLLWNRDWKILKDEPQVPLKVLQSSVSPADRIGSSRVLWYVLGSVFFFLKRGKCLIFKSRKQRVCVYHPNHKKHQLNNWQNFLLSQKFFISVTGYFHGHCWCKTAAGWPTERGLPVTRREIRTRPGIYKIFLCCYSLWISFDSLSGELNSVIWPRSYWPGLTKQKIISWL